MENQFIPHNLSLQLRKLGFDDHCLGWYQKMPNSQTPEKLHIENVYENSLIGVFCSCTAPLWQQAFDWFRVKYELIQSVGVVNADYTGGYSYGIIKNHKGHLVMWRDEILPTYEEAKLKCLQKLIELINKES